MKITRDAFLYLGPKGDDFAQCATCCFSDKGRCAVLGRNVDASGSCGYYLPGQYDGTPIKPRVSAKDAGYVVRQVRCENCRFSHGTLCKLFEALNGDAPAIFDLDTKIQPDGCCNAQTPR